MTLPTFTAFLDAGHARHAFRPYGKGEETICGAHLRMYANGTFPQPNHQQPYRRADVTCKRCLKKLPNPNQPPG